MIRKILRKMLNIAIILLVVYAGLALYMFRVQSRLVFYPYPDITHTPASVDLAYEEVWLQLNDTERVHAWYIPGPENRERGHVLFCHGNAGNISHRLQTIQILHELGFATLIFDYRGYGRSSGNPGETATYEDAMAAWEWLTGSRGVSPERIVIFGRSLGGAVAAWLAQQVDPAGLIVESSFTSVPDMGRDLYPFLPVKLLSRIHYDTRSYIAKAKCPVAVIHSRDDELINFRHGQALFAAAAEPKRMIEIVGRHNETMEVTGDRYIRELDQAMSWMLSKGL